MKSMERPLRRPKRLPNGLRAWTSHHYDRAADAVMNAIGISPEEWGRVRYAIRLALEIPEIERDK